MANAVLEEYWTTPREERTTRMWKVSVLRGNILKVHYVETPTAPSDEMLESVKELAKNVIGEDPYDKIGYRRVGR